MQLIVIPTGHLIKAISTAGSTFRVWNEKIVWAKWLNVRYSSGIVESSFFH